MLIAWTTVATKEDAQKLADSAIGKELAVCVQIEGPITSTYRWHNKIEHSQEYRLMFKLLHATQLALESHINQHHPYDTPEWIVVPIAQIGEKYLSWAQASSTSSPL